MNDGLRNIVFFDGYCGFCSSTVESIAKWDQGKTIYFAPLQGDLARELLPETYYQSMDSLVFRLKDGTLLTRAQAVIGICKNLSAIHKGFAFILGSLPNKFVNQIYDIIAKHRQSLKVTCPVATHKNRLQFEDRFLK